MSLKFALLAGEASGDAQGASLVKEIRSLAPDSKFLGVGGPRMRDAGVGLLYDSSGWGAIGVFESLKLVRPLTRARGELVSRMAVCPPDLLVPIDFGYFNLRVAHPLRAAGIPVLYYFPPRSWSRDAAVSTLFRESVDAVATPFPWSAERLREAGITASFVGHPLLESLAETPARRDLCREWQIDAERPIVALLPGSRKHEVRYLWPRLQDAAKRVSTRIPGVQFVTAVAPTVDRSWLQQSAGDRRTRDHADRPAINLINGRASEVLSIADVVATCSGTASLEAAIREKPMVVVYGGSPLMGLEWRLRRRQLGISFIAMPNVIAGREIVTELIQDAASPSKIAAEIISLLSNAERAGHMRQELAVLKETLGSPGAARRTAEIAVAMARGQAVPTVTPPQNGERARRSPLVGAEQRPGVEGKVECRA